MARRSALLGAIVMLWTDVLVEEASAQDPASLAERSPYLLVVRLAEDVFTRDQRRIVETGRVDEVVLGVRARGNAEVRGDLTVKLFPDRNDTGLVLVFSGTCRANTISQSGPAIIYTVVTTRFECRKPIVFNLKDGFRYGPASVDAQVIDTRRCVQATVPGLRRRLVHRAATRRLQENSGYLNYVAKRNAERRMQSSFDQQANSRLASLNEQFHSVRQAIARVSEEQEQGEYELLLNTTDRYFQMGIVRQGMVVPHLPDTGVAPGPLQVWLHASIFGQDAPALLETWAHLGLLLPTRATALGLASALRTENRDRKLDLDVTLLPPWVVISASRNRS